MVGTWYGSGYDFPHTAYPGETMQFSVVVNGKLPSTVSSTISPKNSGFENVNAKPAGAHL